MNSADPQRLIDYLWPNGDRLDSPHVHMLLDGARDPVISDWVMRGDLEWKCLFGGELNKRLQAAAPYLVRLEPSAPLTHSLLRHSWGKSWGILTTTPPHISTDDLRIHFKKLLKVRDEEGNEMAFRFYDPRVLTAFLPSCLDVEIAHIFGPVSSLVAQSDDACTFIRYTPSSPGAGASMVRTTL